jgi:hypothetical protein
MDVSRRSLLKIAAALLVDQWAGSRRGAFASAPVDASAEAGRKVIVVTCGGMRRSECFAESGFDNIPHLYREMLPQSVFYPLVGNAGVTSHFNTISSILSGNYQRLDDWGKTPPASPTFFEYVRKSLGISQNKAWLISSNKALTSQIGASSAREFGPRYGANVVFPKQMLINAVVHAAAQGRAVHSADRATVQPEIEAMLNAENYDGLGWSVLGEGASLDAQTLGSVQRAIEDLVRTNAPVTGDEFTHLVSLEVMRRFAPSLVVITFSDMEVAHFGSYSLYLSGIRTVDRLVSELWNEVQVLPAYKAKTTLLVLPEFGRDRDGSTTNGFFNHRQNTDTTRLIWMMCLGEAARHAQVMEQPVDLTDLCPTIVNLFGIKKLDLPGKPLPGLGI